MGAHVSGRRDVQHVLDGIRRIVHGLHESSRAAERTLGVTGAQLFVLRRLADAGALSVSDLARRTFTHQSSVSTVVARLRAAGLVRQRTDPRDRRRRLLALTPAGRTMIAAAPHASQERLIRAVLDLTPSARRTVARALARMADTMAAARRPAMFFEGRSRRA